MNEEIFRKKSLDKIKSPESLNDYVRVTNPGVWLLLAAVIVLLVGAVIWGVYGHVDTLVDADMHVKNGEAFCYISAEDVGAVESGMTIKCRDAEGTVKDVDYKMSCATADIDLPDGHYDASIVIESINPISFILN